jgi:hypothetical protein
MSFNIIFQVIDMEFMCVCVCVRSCVHACIFEVIRMLVRVGIIVCGSVWVLLILIMSFQLNMKSHSVALINLLHSSNDEAASRVCSNAPVP